MTIVVSIRRRLRCIPDVGGIIEPTMELRQLRAFVEVAAAGHFGRAAERLRVTQPALTQRIQGLERELGVQLLERNAREVRLAPAGALLLPHALRLVQGADQAQRDLKAYSSGMVGRLRLAYQASGDLPTAGSIIAEYRRRFPAVDIETTSGSSGPNLKLVQNHLADAAFALMPSARPDGISARTIRREEVALALRSDHHLAQMEPIPVKALRGELIGLPPAALNPHLIAAIRHWLERHTGEELNVVSEDPPELAIETVARSGSAALLIVRRYAATPPAAGIAYHSISPPPFIELTIAYRSDDPSPTLANLIQLVDELVIDDSGVPDDGELI
jgi:DNA-binding transcriptional LysR family regulator